LADKVRGPKKKTECQKILNFLKMVQTQCRTAFERNLSKIV